MKNRKLTCKKWISMIDNRRFQSQYSQRIGENGVTQAWEALPSVEIRA